MDGGERWGRGIRWLGNTPDSMRFVLACQQWQGVIRFGDPALLIFGAMELRALRSRDGSQRANPGQDGLSVYSAGVG